MTPRVFTLLEKDKGLLDNPAARAYFFTAEGKPRPVGTLLRNPDTRGRFASSPRRVPTRSTPARSPGTW